MREVEALYAPASGYHKTRLAVGEQAFALMARCRASKLQPHISASDRVFEFGVGTGLNLAELRCAAKAGYDIGAHLAGEVQRRGIAWVPATSSVPDDHFDAVICHHVLEHVSNPCEVLLELRRLLRPGGLLLLHVPYERERRYRHFDSDEPNHHLFSWNPQTLGNLAAVAGYTVESAGLGAYGYERFAGQFSARWLCGRGYGVVLNALRMILPVAEVRMIARKPRT